MRVVIIEDELLTAEDLRDLILSIDPKIEIAATLYSVQEAIAYFSSNPMPYLIFSDIQLGDGLRFEFFSSIPIKAPVVFCTAFDEYAIKAFNANGIHYVLKPFSAQKIKDALAKYYELQTNFSPDNNAINQILAELKQAQQQNVTKKSASVLVYYQNKIIPIRLEEVAVFFVKNETTHLYTFDHRTYVVNKSLDELQQLDQARFYRANRQFIVNRQAIKEATHYQARKVSVELNIDFS